MSHEALNPEQFEELVSKRQHHFQDIDDPSILADHMASSHGVDPDKEGWKRQDLLQMHRDMHS